MFWSLIFNLNVWLIKITHAVLIISIIGLFSGTLFSKVPFVKIYGKIIQWLALILLIASIFFEGYFYASKSWLEKAKEYLIGNTILSLESSDAMAEYFAMQDITGEEITNVDKLIQKIRKVTSEDVRRVAKEIFANDRLVLGVVGPVKETESLKRAFRFK